MNPQATGVFAGLRDCADCFQHVATFREVARHEGHVAILHALQRASERAGREGLAKLVNIAERGEIAFNPARIVSDGAGRRGRRHCFRRQRSIERQPLAPRVQVYQHGLLIKMCHQRSPARPPPLLRTCRTNSSIPFAVRFWVWSC